MQVLEEEVEMIGDIGEDGWEDLSFGEIVQYRKNNDNLVVFVSLFPFGNKGYLVKCGVMEKPLFTPFFYMETIIYNREEAYSSITERKRLAEQYAERYFAPES